MPPKKRLMNDMVPAKKPAPTKQALPAEKKPAPALLKPPRKIIYEEPELEDEIDQEEDFSPVSRRPIITYKEDQKSRGRGFVWFVSFVCIVALTLAIGGLFTEARIEITPKTYQGTVDMGLTLPQVKTATKTFTEEMVVPATSVSDKETYATGIIRFFNAGPSKAIPKGTVIVSSHQKEFITTKAVTVPSVKAKVLGQIDVSVTAKVSGSESNIGMDDFTFVAPTKNTAGITIHSVSAMSGGAKGQDSIADPAAVEAATLTLKSKFAQTDTLIKRMSEEIPETAIVLPVMFPEHTPEIVTEASHADGVHIIANQTIAIILVDKKDIARKIGDALNAPDGMKLTIDNFDGLTVTTNSISSNLPIPDTIQVRITGTGLVKGMVESDQIIAQVKGSYRKTVRNLLSETPEIDTFKITMRPFWRRSLPSSTDDISVNVK